MIFFLKVRSKSSKSSNVINVLSIKYLILKNVGTKKKKMFQKFRLKQMERNGTKFITKSSRVKKLIMSILY